MKAKIKLLSLVLGIALSGILFTQCVKNEESDGVRAVREGYANKLLADADYQKALAEKERANAEYIKLQAQWDKAKAEAEVELKKVEAELKKVEVDLKKVELEKEKLNLEEKKAALEVKLAELKNQLLAAQQAYALALINNETALIAANKLLAEAKATLLASDPKLEEYLALKEKLYNVVNGLYPQKTAKLVEKLGLQAELIELQYAVNSEKLALLVKDSLKAATDLEYAKKLLEKYESLDGLSVAALQGKADDAKIEWEKAKIAAQDLNVVKTEKEGELTVANAALTQANTDLTAIKAKLTSSSLTIVDSLYSYTQLGYNNGAGNTNVYPAPLANLVSRTEVSSYGAQNILNLVSVRLAYLTTASTANQLFRPNYTTTPGYDYPTRKWLEDKIAHIENDLLPSVATEIADQKAIIATAQGKFDAGKEAWEEAKESYLGAVSGVNTAVDGLRAQLSVWQTGVDLINAAGSTVTDITENQKTAIFSAIKTYYVTRYNFDRKTSVVANIPTTWAGLNDVAVFSRDIFFSSVAVVDYQTYINNLKTDSDIKIRNNYEWRNYEDNADVISGYAVIAVNFPASTSTVPEAYVNSTIGKYLYLSRNVYGASALADVHYYLPYNVRPLPTEQAPNVPSYPDINNYNSSLFKILADAKNVLAELEANAANTFYVENYKSVLGVVNRTIAYYEGLKTEYEAKVVEINAEIEAQQAVVDAKKAAKDAAQLASDKATVDYNAANTYAGTLGYIYDQLKDVTGTTLYIIKEAIATQETKINALVTALKNAGNALREYRASGDAGDLIAKLVAEKEAKIAAIDAEIAILEIAIAEIEAKMEELLKDDE